MSKRSQRKRAFLRRKGRATIRNAVDRMEAVALRKFAADRRLYCPILLGTSPASIPELPTAEIPDNRQPCGGRLRSVRKLGAIVPGLFECRRCGRQTLASALAPAPEENDLSTPQAEGSPEAAAAEIVADTVEMGLLPGTDNDDHSHEEIARFEGEGGPGLA